MDSIELLYNSSSMDAPVPSYSNFAKYCILTISKLCSPLFSTIFPSNKILCGQCFY